MGIAIVVLAYNRLHLLRQCVENVLLRTSEATREILIWDNASDAETVSYLDSLTDPRIRVVHSPENLGQNGYVYAFPLTSSDHLIQVDDDVIDAPRGWDAALLDAFERLPDVGYLATNIFDDGHSRAAEIFYRSDRHLYTSHEVAGVRLLEGPTGGWCSMTSRELHDRVGGYSENKKSVFWLADEDYIHKLQKLGYRRAILEDVKVFHASGPYYSEEFPQKLSYWARRSKDDTRKAAVKRQLLRVPLVCRMNERYGWFAVPAD
jgi:GT2 family glycosyltransferase